MDSLKQTSQQCVHRGFSICKAEVKQSAQVLDLQGPGGYLAGKLKQSMMTDISCCCRSPDALMQTIEAVLRAFDAQAGSRGMVADAASLMNPEVIKTMRDLQQQIRKQFM